MDKAEQVVAFMVTPEVIVGVLTLIGVIITAHFQLISKRYAAKINEHARQINDAVNHRHEKRGATAGKLYDLVWENHEKADELLGWKRSYDEGPLDNGHKVEKFVKETEEHFGRLDRFVEATSRSLEEITKMIKDSCNSTEDRVDGNA